MTENYEPKKLAIVRILQILQKHSGDGHALTQADICERLKSDYGITLERKAIGNAISLLKDAGYDIETGGGNVLHREFEDSELRLLIDSVMSMRHIPSVYASTLIDKLCNLSDEYFRARIKNAYAVPEWSRNDNRELFLTVDTFDAAIASGRRVAFDYNRYEADGALHKTKTHTVSPYQMVVRNGHYFLIALNERHGNLGFYRIDKITHARQTDEPSTPLREVEGYSRGLDYGEIATGYPYMYTDRPEPVVFEARVELADQIIDWFGDNARIEQTDGALKVTVRASATAMEYWAMQYLNSVEIVSPQSLRDRIKANLAAAIKKYN